MTSKPIITVKYDTLQSQSGKIFVLGETKYFEKIDVAGNRLLLYESDNGHTKNGRIGGIYNLDAFDISFL